MLVHGIQEDARQASVGLQRQPLQDQAGGLNRLLIGGLLSKLAEASLPEDDHHRGADGVVRPAVLDLLQELHLVGAIAEVASRPQHGACGSGPTPARELLFHLHQHLTHELHVALGPKFPGALPELQRLAAGDDLVLGDLAHELDAAVLLDVHEHVGLVKAGLPPRALRRAHPPDLLRPAGRPHGRVPMPLLGVFPDAHRLLDHQHDVAEHAARGSSLHEPAGAADEEHVAHTDVVLERRALFCRRRLRSALRGCRRRLDLPHLRRQEGQLLRGAGAPHWRTTAALRSHPHGDWAGTAEKGRAALLLHVWRQGKLRPLLHGRLGLGLLGLGIERGHLHAARLRRSR
mmetsp:Transcript_56083/g.147488  ORF Transcript_56083/g.147488 Transcript_56083/m.147488 type:complete len:346 (+) Transcript_56083:1945-2982(+)